MVPPHLRERVSVIVPVYGVEPFLPACIQSIREQTYPDLEIILVDDGSPDRCGEICDEAARADPRIRVLHQENGGVSDARNAGLDQATGSLLLFVDGDDAIEPGHVAALYRCMLESRAEMSVVGFVRFAEDAAPPRPPVPAGTVPWYRLDQRGAFEDVIHVPRYLATSVCGKLYRAPLWTGIRFPKGKIFEDMVATYDLLFRIERTAVLQLTPGIRYAYRRRRGSTMTSPFSPALYDYVEHTDLVLDRLYRRYPDLAGPIRARKLNNYRFILGRALETGADGPFQDLIRDLEEKIRAVEQEGPPAQEAAPPSP